MPAAGVENYFLGSMVTQWRTSGRADAPALLRADRTLALAYESTRLAREEFLEQANWALSAKRVDTARALFEAAINLDPTDPRAKAGVKLVGKLEKGEVSFDDLKKASVDELVQDKKDVPPPAPMPPAGPAPKDAPADPNVLLRDRKTSCRERV